MTRLARVWAAFLDWCNPDRYVCHFSNLTDEDDQP